MRAQPVAEDEGFDQLDRRAVLAAHEIVDPSENVHWCRTFREAVRSHCTPGFSAF